MKNRFIQHMIIFFAGIALFSCSNNEYEEDNNTNIGITKGIPVITTLATEPLPENIQCAMYVFWKSSDDPENEYALKETKLLENTDQNTLKFMNNELVGKSYRFLFIATPSLSNEIELVTSDGNEIQTECKWNNIIIKSSELLLSADNYQGFVDKSGEEILNGKTINCTLTRLVGQIIFDIYKVLKDGETTTSQDVALPHLTVLDRVFKIEIQYSNITKSAVYNNNDIIHHDIWTDTYMQTIEPKLYENNNFKVDIAQAVDNLTFSEEKKGSAHIKGIYCMPSNNNMKIKMTFHYYDTTPFCGLDEVHSSSCFTAKTIVLNLPKSGNTPLSIIPNHFTLNTAKIRYDRIIDVGANFSFAFDTTWKNDNE
jgi:hypothetical protein